MALFQQISQFAQSIQGKGDPQQLVNDFVRKNGISQDQLNSTIQKAQNIARMFGGMN